LPVRAVDAQPRAKRALPGAALCAPRNCRPHAGRPARPSRLQHAAPRRTRRRAPGRSPRLWPAGRRRSPSARRGARATRLLRARRHLLHAPVPLSCRGRPRPAAAAPTRPPTPARRSATGARPRPRRTLPPRLDQRATPRARLAGRRPAASHQPRGRAQLPRGEEHARHSGPRPPRPGRRPLARAPPQRHALALQPLAPRRGCCGGGRRPHAALPGEQLPRTALRSARGRGERGRSSRRQAASGRRLRSGPGQARRPQRRCRARRARAARARWRRPSWRRCRCHRVQAAPRRRPRPAGPQGRRRLGAAAAHTPVRRALITQCKSKDLRISAACFVCWKASDLLCALCLGARAEAYAAHAGPARGRHARAAQHAGGAAWRAPRRAAPPR